MEERINELRSKLSNLEYEGTRVSATMWTEKRRKEHRAQYNEILDELKALIPVRIVELEKEREEIEKVYPRRRKYLAQSQLEKHYVARQRVNKIREEIGILRWYQQLESHN